MIMSYSIVRKIIPYLILVFVVLLHSSRLLAITIGENYAGGIVFYVDENGKQGLIAAKGDILSNWFDVNDACNNLKIGGYSGWTLPNKWQLQQLFKQNSAVGGFFPEFYFTSVCDTNVALLISINDGHELWDNTMHPARCRPVRAFNIDKEVIENATRIADPVIGQFYKGGVIAYIFKPGDLGYISGEKHGIIASKDDISYTGVFGPKANKPNTNDPSFNDRILPRFNSYNAEGYFVFTENCTRRKETLVGTSTSIGSGKANTVAILSQWPKSVYRYTAAAMCDSYSITENGVKYDDWYLPSKDELYQLSINSGTIGVLYNCSYWSSSEYDNDDVWQQEFTYSSRLSEFSDKTKSKIGINHIRAIRYF
jgi:hypothetical protein